jgi:hypothetical protein
MTYVYIQNSGDPNGSGASYSVGFYDPQGRWQPESEHGESEKAARRVAWLNGANTELLQFLNQAAGRADCKESRFPTHADALNALGVTEGPWSIGDDRCSPDQDEIPVYEPNGAVVCSVWPVGEDFDDLGRAPIARTNARVIAAIPTVIAKLQAIRAYDEQLDGKELAPTGDDYNVILSIARDAIRALEHSPLASAVPHDNASKVST